MENSEIKIKKGWGGKRAGAGRKRKVVETVREPILRVRRVTQADREIIENAWDIEGYQERIKDARLRASLRQSGTDDEEKKQEALKTGVVTYPGLMLGLCGKAPENQGRCLGLPQEHWRPVTVSARRGGEVIEERAVRARCHQAARQQAIQEVKSKKLRGDEAKRFYYERYEHHYAVHKKRQRHCIGCLWWYRQHCVWAMSGEALTTGDFGL